MRDKEKRKAYMKQYRQANKDKIKASTAQWRADHKESWAAINKRSRQKNRESILEFNRTPERRFNTARYDAKRRELPFELTFDFWWAEVQKPCHYCQDQLGKRSETTVGLDRMNNALGYLPDNVCSCCDFCNSLKQHLLTPEETHAAVKAILGVRAAQMHLS
jgi:hypothetical protein